MIELDTAREKGLSYKQIEFGFGGKAAKDLLTRVASEVESWNWNLNIFEIYDEIKHTRASKQEHLLGYAYNFFNKDSLFLELASHLGIYNIKE